MMVYALDGGGPKDYENTLNLFLTKRNEELFWQIGTDMKLRILNFQNKNRGIDILSHFSVIQGWKLAVSGTCKDYYLFPC